MTEKSSDLGSTRHCAVIIDQLARSPRPAEARRACKRSDRGLGCGPSASAPRPPRAISGEDVARTGEVAGARIRVGPDCARSNVPVIGRDARRGAMLVSPPKTVNAVVWAESFSATMAVRFSRFGLLARHRRADDCQTWWRTMKAIFLGRAVHRRDDQVAFVFAAAVIGDNDDLAGFKCHGIASTTRAWSYVMAEVFQSEAAGLAAVSQIVVRRAHRATMASPIGTAADTDARVMTAPGLSHPPSWPSESIERRSLRIEEVGFDRKPGDKPAVRSRLPPRMPPELLGQEHRLAVGTRCANLVGIFLAADRGRLEAVARSRRP